MLGAALGGERAALLMQSSGVGMLTASAKWGFFWSAFVFGQQSCPDCQSIEGPNLTVALGILESACELE